MSAFSPGRDLFPPEAFESRKDSIFLYPRPQRNKNAKWNLFHWLSLHKVISYTFLVTKCHIFRDCLPRRYRLYTTHQYTNITNIASRYVFVLHCTLCNEVTFRTKFFFISFIALLKKTAKKQSIQVEFKWPSLVPWLNIFCQSMKLFF